MRLFFENGVQFTADDTHRTAIALAVYGSGLLSYAWVKVGKVNGLTYNYILGKMQKTYDQSDEEGNECYVPLNIIMMN